MFDIVGSIHHISLDVVDHLTLKTSFKLSKRQVALSCKHSMGGMETGSLMVTMEGKAGADTPANATQFLFQEQLRGVVAARTGE